MWTEIKFACGHTAEVQLYGSGESREWKARQMANDLCPECKAKKENEELGAFESEESLPELDGSPNQISWARKIRKSMIEKWEGEDVDIERAEEKFEEYKESGKYSDEKIAALKEDVECAKEAKKTLYIVRIALRKISSAKWFIENRSFGMTNHNIIRAYIEYAKHPEYDYDHLMDTCKELVREYGGELEEKPQEQKDAEAEATLVPEGHEDAKIIRIKQAPNGWVEVCDRVDYSTYLKLHDLGFNKDCEHQINSMTPPAADVAAAAIAALLKAGYRVLCYDAEARQKAIDGTWEPEDRHWIYSNKSLSKEGRVVIQLVYGEDLYDAAREIRGSRYSRPDVTVPASEWADIEEWARVHGYRISPGAQKLLDTYKEQTTVVTDIKQVELKHKDDKLGQILESSADVLEDLKDGD